MTVLRGKEGKANSSVPRITTLTPPPHHHSGTRKEEGLGEAAKAMKPQSSRHRKPPRTYPFSRKGGITPRGTSVGNKRNTMVLLKAATIT